MSTQITKEKRTVTATRYFGGELQGTMVEIIIPNPNFGFDKISIPIKDYKELIKDSVEFFIEENRS